MTQSETVSANRVVFYGSDVTVIDMSSKGEAPFKLIQHLTAIYTAMSAPISMKETKVIPPDCFF